MKSLGKNFSKCSNGACEMKFGFKSYRDWKQGKNSKIRLSKKKKKKKFTWTP